MSYYEIIKNIVIPKWGPRQELSVKEIQNKCIKYEWMSDSSRTYGATVVLKVLSELIHDKWIKKTKRLVKNGSLRGRNINYYSAVYFQDDLLNSYEFSGGWENPYMRSKYRNRKEIL